MIANYHTHTKRCRHATGSDEEYVKYAVERGLSILGFSDHTPYFYDGGYYSDAKMRMDEMSGYFASILSLREKYKDKIDIKIGFETEYFPKFFDRLVAEYRKYPLDYIILGQHVIGDESTDNSENAFGVKRHRSSLSRFVDQCSEALATGRFSCFAHPDIINYVTETREDGEFLESEYERLITAAIKTETPLEINLCGIRNGRNYPDPRFWQMAGKLGADVVIGSDAHAPWQVADPEELKIGYRIVRENRLKLLDTLPIKNPTF